MRLARLLATCRQIRVIGFDDAHYPDKSRGAKVNIGGVVCSDARVEGMLWGEIRKDGMGATDEVIRLVRDSKFAEQVRVILLDGLTMGGGDVLDLPRIHEEIGCPAVAVMRKRPNLKAFHAVLELLSESEERKRRVEAAGPIHELNGQVFQVCGEEPEVMSKVLQRLTIEGKVPEALRMAHILGRPKRQTSVKW
jgi:uncharacterized protein